MVIFDASAVLAYLRREAGADLVFVLAPNAVLSSVNAAEAQSRQVRHGVDPHLAWVSVVSCVQEIVSFDAAQAEIAGTLISQTQPLGLSLGDRACLALGLAMKCPVYTADRAWAGLQVGVDVRLIR